MISKKKMELINGILELVPEEKAKEAFDKKVEKKVVYNLSLDATKILLSCKKCGQLSELPSTSSAVCPKCGNSKNVRFNIYRQDDESDFEGYNIQNTASMGEEKYVLNFIGIYEENLFILQYDVIVEPFFLTDDVVLSVWSLTVFDQEHRPTFFQNSTGDWTNKTPSRSWYGSMDSLMVYLSPEAEKKYEDNPIIQRFNKGYYSRHEGDKEFQSYLNNVYKSLRDEGIMKGPEKRTKEKEIVEYPDFEKLPAEVLYTMSSTKCTILENKIEGMVSKLYCPVCGQHSMQAQQDHFSSCPACGATNLAKTKYYSRTTHSSSFVIIDEIENGIILSLVTLFSSLNEVKNSIDHSVYYNSSMMITDEKVVMFDKEHQQSSISAMTSTFSNAFDYNSDKTNSIINNTTLSIKEIMHFGVLKYSGLYEFVESLVDTVDNETLEFDLIQKWFKNIEYHSLYEKSHIIELFSKCKMSNFVKDLCSKVSYPKWINKKATTIQEALDVDNNHFNQIRENNLDLATTERFIEIIHKDNLVNYEDVETFISSYYGYDNFKSYMEVDVPYFGNSLKKKLHYLQSLDEYQCIGWNEAINIWIDYINMCAKLKCDLSDRDVVCTNSLKLEHDRAVKKFNALKDAETAENFIEAVNRYKEYEFAPEEYDFFVKVPDSQEELYEEGRKLNHCVGSYVDRITKGNAIILFIRRKSEPDKPLATAEIRGVQMYQVRAKYNSSPMGIPNMKNFLKEWAKEKKISMRNLNLSY